MSARSIKETVERVSNFEQMAMDLGITVMEIYWTQGQYDGLAILEAPDSDSISALMLMLNSTGNVRTETFRAYSRDDMIKILAKLP